MTTAKYYYESHITVEPIEDTVLLDTVKKVSEDFGFRVADLYMVKNRSETPERSNRDTFMTGHGKDFKFIVERTKALCQNLSKLGVKVWRYKIEDTLLDSRHEDVLGIL